MKCKLCGEKIETHFLGKIKGTHVKVDGEEKAVCSDCQAEHDMDEIKQEL